MEETKMKKEDMIMVSDRTEAFLEGVWSYGEKMITKYYLGNDLDGVMGMDPDVFKDMTEMYKWSKELKDLTLLMARQMDQIALTNALIVNQNKELLEEIGVLQEEIDSLKSKAKKND